MTNRLGAEHLDGCRAWHAELPLMLATGAGHLAVERWAPPIGGVAPDVAYNVAAVLAWSGYVVWRVLTVPGQARVWGFRRDPFAAALGRCAAFIVPAVAVLLAYGWWHGMRRLPSSFWLVIAVLYPLYGIAQQFALQNLLARHLPPSLGRVGRAIVAAALFSLAHAPDAILMVLTFAAGAPLTWIYARWPNLWAVGLSHGLLGACAYYFVLGKDPGGELIRWVARIASG